MRKLVLVNSDGEQIPNVEPYVLKENEDLDCAISKFINQANLDLLERDGGAAGGYFEWGYREDVGYYQLSYVQTDNYYGGIKVIEE